MDEYTRTQAYQIRLFLESFGIRSALLNAELPINSRSHILQSFNKGLFDYLIATGNKGEGEGRVGVFVEPLLVNPG